MGCSIDGYDMVECYGSSVLCRVWVRSGDAGDDFHWNARYILHYYYGILYFMCLNLRFSIARVWVEMVYRLASSRRIEGSRK